MARKKLQSGLRPEYTEDGGAPPYDYAKAPLAHDDLQIDIQRLDDYELLTQEDILGEGQEE